MSESRNQVTLVVQPDAIVPAEWEDAIAARAEIGGRLCVVQSFMVTSGLLVGVRFDEFGYSYDARYCFEHSFSAFAALHAWDGTGDPPGPWIKEKVSERLGPGARDEEIPF